MRSSLMCVGIVVALLVTACEKQEKVTAPLLPVPECKADQVRGLDRSGDLLVVSNQFLQHRKAVEALLSKRDPKLLPRFTPLLDAQFSEARLRARAVCTFVALASDSKGLEAHEDWSRSPEMQAINTAIWSRTPAPSEEEDVQMTPARMALLREIVVALALQQVEVNIQKADRDDVPGLVSVLGPAPLPNAMPLPNAAPAGNATSAGNGVPAANAAPAVNTVPASSAPPAAANTAPTANAAPAVNAAPAANATPAVNPVPTAGAAAIANPQPAANAVLPMNAIPASSPPLAPIQLPEVDAVVERWLLPVLMKIPDDDLADYLAFANSGFGSDYYVALSRNYDFRAGEWYAQAVKVFKDNIPPAEQVAGGPSRDTLVSDARRLLRDVGIPAAAADAMGKLLQADRLDPRNAEIQTLLGEAMIKTAPLMPLGPGQLRVVIDTPNYAEADRYLSKAIELAPTQADAHMLLGRLRYLQGRDDEAMQLFTRAREIEPDHPSMDLYLGDLSYVQNAYARAIIYYKAAVSKPERLAYTHVNALAHLLMAMRKGTQLAEYPSIADAYLAKYPQAWNFRLDYADYLLSTNTRADKVLPIVEPIPDTWYPSRKIPALSAALVRKAVERADRPTGEPIDESVRIIQRSMTVNPDPVAFAEAICRSEMGSRLLTRTMEISKNPKALATALVICGMRWQRHGIVKHIAKSADIAILNLPHPDLGDETPLCYAARTKNLPAFVELVEVRVSPARKCKDGKSVAERLVQMSYGRDPSIIQMQVTMDRIYKKE
jgi:tetratricopeptide (TPR) repeat protein